MTAKVSSSFKLNPNATPFVPAHIKEQRYHLAVKKDLMFHEQARKIEETYGSLWRNLPQRLRDTANFLIGKNWFDEAHFSILRWYVITNQNPNNPSWNYQNGVDYQALYDIMMCGVMHQKALDNALEAFTESLFITRGY